MVIRISGFIKCSASSGRVEQVGRPVACPWGAFQCATMHFNEAITGYSI